MTTKSECIGPVPGVPEPRTLVELLRSRAEQHPTRAAYTWFPDGETEERSLRWGELDAQVRALAGNLQGMKLAGERALLLYESGLDFLVAFLACLDAGLIAVPSHAPRSKRHFARLKGKLLMPSHVSHLHASHI